VITNTLYINYTPEAIALVEKWERKCIEALEKPDRHEVWDQTCFRDVLLEGHDAKFEPIPPSYGRIFDKITEEELWQDTTVLHFQASRHFKKWINNELVQWQGLDRLTAKDAAGFSLLEALKAISDREGIFPKDSSHT